MQMATHRLLLRSALLLYLFFSIFSEQAQGLIRVHEFLSYQQLLKNTTFKKMTNDPTTLVVIDIDNTLLYNSHTIGSPAWFDWQLACYANHMPCRQGQSFSDVIAVNDHWLARHDLPLASPDVTDFYHYLKDHHVHWVIVTARSATLFSRTQHNLDKQHIFPMSSRLLHATNIHDHTISIRPQMIMTSGQNKAKALAIYLKNRHQKPKHIILIDDAKSNFKAMTHWIRHHHDSVDLVFYRFNRFDQHYHEFFQSAQDQVQADKDFQLEWQLSRTMRSKK